jgi:hypothetical protein
MRGAVIGFTSSQAPIIPRSHLVTASLVAKPQDPSSSAQPHLKGSFWSVAAEQPCLDFQQGMGNYFEY